MKFQLKHFTPSLTTYRALRSISVTKIMLDSHQEPQYNYGNPPPLGKHADGAKASIPAPPVLNPPMQDYRPHALGQSFNLVERFKTGKPSLGYGLFLGTPYLARLVGAGGFDWVMIDWEHTPMSIREITELIKWVQFGSEGVPNIDHQWISWCLDAGASAVILPHTETVEQARAMVKATKFPNKGGHRSYPPAAVAMGFIDGAPAGKDRFDVWNTAAVIMQIESSADNAEEIAAVEGVDCLMVGTGDLRLDLGLSGGDGPEEEYNSCLEKIVDAGMKYDKPVICFSAGPGDVERRLKQGFSGFIVGNDSWAVCKAMRESLQAGHQDLVKWQENGAKVEGWQFK